VEQLNITYKQGDDGARHATLPDDTIAYVRKFIQDTSAKSPTEIAAAVQEGHDAVLRNIDGLSDAQARYKPAPAVWSALETMAHLVTVKRVTVALTSNLGAGNLPPGFGPQLENESAQDGVTLANFETIADARDAAQAAHDELLALISSIDDANTDTRFKHFFFGAMNAREWACFQRIHDGDHYPQIASVRVTPGFPAS
jgi:hypothetical protein